MALGTAPVVCAGHIHRPCPAASEEVLEDDKVFRAYVLLTASGVASVITATILNGNVTLPSPALFLQHLAMSYGFRAVCKWIPGARWDDWNFLARTTPAPMPEVGPLPEPEPEVCRAAA